MKTMEFVKKFALPTLGVALTLASTLVNNKNQDAKMEKTIADEVAKALADQTKES